MFCPGTAKYQEQDVPRSLALRIAGLPYLFSMLDIMEVSAPTGYASDFVAQLYNHLGAELGDGLSNSRLVALACTYQCCLERSPETDSEY